MDARNTLKNQPSSRIALKNELEDEFPFGITYFQLLLLLVSGSVSDGT